MLIGLVALLHVLVFVYWLGGDLGAFYISRYVSDPKRPVAVRIAAAQALGALDMAPRTALILALPTGLTLAMMRGVAVVPVEIVVGGWAVSVVWLWMAWRVHRKHLAPVSPVRRLDLAVRWAVMAGLLLAAAGVFGGWIAWPLYLGLKLAVLAAAILTGLVVRRLLAPFGPAFAALATEGATPETDRVIGVTLARVRPAVLLIWLLLLVAALLGLWRPL